MPRFRVTLAPGWLGYFVSMDLDVLNPYDAEQIARQALIEDARRAELVVTELDPEPSTS